MLKHSKILVLVLVSLVVLAAAGAVLGNSRYKEEAIQQITQQITDSLPGDLPIASIVIFPFKGDMNDELYRAVERAIVKQRNFIPLQNEDLDIIKQIDQFNLDPLKDPTWALDIAKRLSAEGIILGEVREWNVSQWKTRIVVDFKMVNMSSLAILWAEHCVGESASPFMKNLHLLVAFIVLVIIAVFLISRGHKIGVRRMLEKAEQARDASKSSLISAKENINSARQKGKDVLSKEFLTKIESRRDELQRLIERIGSINFGDADKGDYKGAASKLKKAEGLKRGVGLIAALASETLDNASSSDSAVWSALDRLGEAISKLRDEMQNFGVFLIGEELIITVRRVLDKVEKSLETSERSLISAKSHLISANSKMWNSKDSYRGIYAEIEKRYKEMDKLIGLIGRINIKPYEKWDYEEALALLEKADRLKLYVSQMSALASEILLNITFPNEVWLELDKLEKAILQALNELQNF